MTTVYSILLEAGDALKENPVWSIGPLLPGLILLRSCLRLHAEPLTGSLKNQLSALHSAIMEEEK